MTDCFLLTENYYSLYYRLQMDENFEIEFKILRLASTLPNFEPIDTEMTESFILVRMYNEEI